MYVLPLTLLHGVLQAVLALYHVYATLPDLLNPMPIPTHLCGLCVCACLALSLRPERVRLPLPTCVRRLRRLPMLDQDGLVCHEAMALARRLCPLQPLSASPLRQHQRRVSATQGYYLEEAERKGSGSFGVLDAGGDEPEMEEVGWGRLAAWDALGGKPDLSLLCTMMTQSASALPQGGAAAAPASRAAEAASAPAFGQVGSSTGACASSRDGGAGCRPSPHTGPGAAAAAAAPLETLSLFFACVRRQHRLCALLVRRGAGVQAMPPHLYDSLCSRCHAVCHMAFTEDGRHLDQVGRKLPRCLECTVGDRRGGFAGAQDQQQQEAKRQRPGSSGGCGDRGADIAGDAVEATGEAASCTVYRRPEVRVYEAWCAALEPLACQTGLSGCFHNAAAEHSDDAARVKQEQQQHLLAPEGDEPCAVGDDAAPRAAVSQQQQAEPARAGPPLFLEGLQSIGLGESCR